MYPVSRARGTNWFFTGVITVFVVFSGSVLAANGPAGNNPNDEGLTQSAVFPRRIGKAAPPYVAPERPASPVPLLFDDQGGTNQLVITLNYDSPGAVRLLAPSLPEAASHSAAEASVVNAVRGKINGTLAALLKPVAIWYLTDGNRLDDIQRGELYKDHPREKLEQFLVLRYQSVADAMDAQTHLARNPAIANVANDREMTMSSVPNDPYFAAGYTGYSPGNYQWGLQAMNFPAAWDVTTGHSYIGVLEPTAAHLRTHLDLDPSQVNNVYLPGNHRAQFDYRGGGSAVTDTDFHSIHVMGIIGATTNNGIGVAGACPGCSMVWQTFNGTSSTVAAALTNAADTGMQVLNWSGGYPSTGDICINPSAPIFASCTAVLYTGTRQVSLVAAAGNSLWASPQWPASQDATISVAAAMKRTTQVASNCPNNNLSWCKWIGPDPNDLASTGTNLPGNGGVFAPGHAIVSTVPPGVQYIPTPWYQSLNVSCSDLLPADASGISGDGYGSCTGTSMAAPHISGLVGLMRSVNPLLPAVDGQDASRSSIKSLVQQSGTNNGGDPALWGYGMPDAYTAVQNTLATNQRRLTPLFTYYSPGRSDSFVTTVPQMARAAVAGTLQPNSGCSSNSASCIYYPWVGYGITGYDQLPDPLSSTTIPRAAAWVFTTPQNPIDANVPLVPLYRFSWKCGDYTPSPPYLCDQSNPNVNLNHVSHVYSADPVNGVTYFQSLGYKLDGIEGYIFPRSMPQPSGTVKLMRKYNPNRDDFAIFPDIYSWYYTSDGYTQNAGNTDWIGYVYPNLTGLMP